MKWPLKYQVMVPMTAVMLGVVVALSALHVYWAARQATTQIVGRIQDVTRTLAKPNFPLTNGVLSQMQGLTGADFVLADQHGHTVASTRSAWPAAVLQQLGRAAGAAPLELASAVQIDDEMFLHTAVDVAPRSPGGGTLVLHVLYPQQAYVRERRQAVMPPLVIGLVALGIVMGLAMAIASRVTQPLGRLREQVSQIAQGDFRPMTLPARDDEVRELAVAVNHMADTLAQYEEKIRRTEQVRALAHLGGSLAHQLRNAVTGARMALDLHRTDCPQGDHDESLAVATRQLILMEKYLQRFLTLDAAPQTAPQEWDVGQLVTQLIPLIQPAARHAAVQLDVRVAAEPLRVCGDRESLEHMVLNILLNAVEAASEIQASAGVRPAEVRVVVSSPRPGRVLLAVTDTGPGPAPAVAARLFEPFATGKKDGAGLGLAVAQGVAQKHGGSVAWNRNDERTTFVVELPLSSKGTDRGERAGS
jgi:signal transduction histidine kinase